MNAVAPFRVLHITDTHLQAEPGSTLLGVDTGRSLAAVLEQAAEERPIDAILATGDLAHDPAPASYRRFREIVRAVHAGPVLHLPGNHDLLAPMAFLLAEPASLRLGAWEIVGFDTHADHRTEAAFGTTELRALEARLERSAADHLLLACHHPPLPVGCPWLDKDRISAGRELLESCAAEGRVRGLVFGHLHQVVTARRGAMAVLGTPSTCFQFEPASASFAVDRDADTGAPGYRWLELGTDGVLTSEVRRLGAFDPDNDASERS